MTSLSGLWVGLPGRGPLSPCPLGGANQISGKEAETWSGGRLDWKIKTVRFLGTRKAMPNWCSTQVVFFGDARRLSIMHKDLLEALDTIKDGDPGWLGRWLVYKNAEEELIRQMHVRGFVEDISFNSDTLTMFSNDAWEPCHLFYALWASYYEVDYELFADEPGNDIFLTTDTEHRFFPRECRVMVNVDSSLLECMPIMRFLNSCDNYIEQETLIDTFKLEFPAMAIRGLDDIVYLLTVECRLMGLAPERSFRIRTLDYEPKLFSPISKRKEGEC